MLVEMTQTIVTENARIAQDQDEYQNATMGWSSGTTKPRLGTMG